jgi:hypothetical protein
MLHFGGLFNFSFKILRIAHFFLDPTISGVPKIGLIGARNLIKILQMSEINKLFDYGFWAHLIPKSIPIIHLKWVQRIQDPSYFEMKDNINGRLIK